MPLSSDSEYFQVHALVIQNNGGRRGRKLLDSPCVDSQGPGTSPAEIRAGHRSGIKIRPQGKEAKSRQRAERNLVLFLGGC